MSFIKQLAGRPDVWPVVGMTVAGMALATAMIIRTSTRNPDISWRTSTSNPNGQLSNSSIKYNQNIKFIKRNDYKSLEDRPKY